jgi:hypothetical protein
VRRIMAESVEDSHRRFECPDPECGGEGRLVCERGCNCWICEG